MYSDDDMLGWGQSTPDPPKGFGWILFIAIILMSLVTYGLMTIADQAGHFDPKEYKVYIVKEVPK